ncbi:MAG: hypothetical protein M1837_001682 [Sclerophora amabilis]|nr:MAG: hypothetical protein M1837_001682 [Sclerophora amabilis]
MARRKRSPVGLLQPQINNGIHAANKAAVSPTVSSKLTSAFPRKTTGPVSKAAKSAASSKITGHDRPRSSKTRPLLGQVLSKPEMNSTIKRAHRLIDSADSNQEASHVNKRPRTSANAGSSHERLSPPTATVKVASVPKPIIALGFKVEPLKRKVSDTEQGQDQDHSLNVRLVGTEASTQREIERPSASKRRRLRQPSSQSVSTSASEAEDANHLDTEQEKDLNHPPGKDLRPTDTPSDRETSPSPKRQRRRLPESQPLFKATPAPAEADSGIEDRPNLPIKRPPGRPRTRKSPDPSTGPVRPVLRLPGRRRNPVDPQIETDLLRQAELRRRYRALTKLVKPVLAELAGRSEHVLEDDPLAHTRSSQYKVVQKGLSDRFDQNIAAQERAFQMDLKIRKATFEANKRILHINAERKFHELKEDFILRCKDEIMHVVRHTQTREDDEATDDGIEPEKREATWMDPDTGLSRSGFFQNTENKWNEFEGRFQAQMAMKNTLQSTAPEFLDERPNDFAIVDSNLRNSAIAFQNMKTLRTAMETVGEEQIGRQSTTIPNSEASGLQALASVSEQILASTIPSSSAPNLALSQLDGAVDVQVEAAKSKRAQSSPKTPLRILNGVSPSNYGSRDKGAARKGDGFISKSVQEPKIGMLSTPVTASSKSPECHRNHDANLNGERGSEKAKGCGTNKQDIISPTQRVRSTTQRGQASTYLSNILNAEDVSAKPLSLGISESNNQTGRKPTPLVSISPKEKGSEMRNEITIGGSGIRLSDHRTLPPIAPQPPNAADGQANTHASSNLLNGRTRTTSTSAPAPLPRIRDSPAMEYASPASSSPSGTEAYREQVLSNPTYSRGTLHDVHRTEPHDSHRSLSHISQGWNFPFPEQYPQARPQGFSPPQYHQHYSTNSHYAPSHSVQYTTPQAPSEYLPSFQAPSSQRQDQSQPVPERRIDSFHPYAYSQNGSSAFPHNNQGFPFQPEKHQVLQPPRYSNAYSQYPSPIAPSYPPQTVYPPAQISPSQSSDSHGSLLLQQPPHYGPSPHIPAHSMSASSNVAHPLQGHIQGAMQPPQPRNISFAHYPANPAFEPQPPSAHHDDPTRRGSRDGW